jgi:hypothetical protein
MPFDAPVTTATLPFKSPIPCRCGLLHHGVTYKCPKSAQRPAVAKPCLPSEGNHIRLLKCRAKVTGMRPRNQATVSRGYKTLRRPRWNARLVNFCIDIPAIRPGTVTAYASAFLSVAAVAAARIGSACIVLARCGLIRETASGQSAHNARLEHKAFCVRSTMRNDACRRA